MSAPKKDIYTRVAEQTGVSRNSVKALALSIMYCVNCPETEEELESKLLQAIKLIREVSSTHSKPFRPGG